VLWHIHPFLDNDQERNNEPRAIAKQQHRKYATILELLRGRGPRGRMEVLLEVVFAVGLSLGYITRPNALN
jgi:hypothetical protein